MSYLPRPLKNTGDISRGTPSSIPLWKLAFASVAILLAAYLILGLFADLVAVHIPASYERKLKVLWSGIAGLPGGDTAQGEAATVILNTLLPRADLPRLEYTVHVIDNPEVNAWALPGGTIHLTKGLFDQVHSEEGMAMVIGHELGHFKHRHHLRRLGRAVLFQLVITLALGDSDTARALMGVLKVGEARYSRSQESTADEFGLELLVAVYGHAGGATEFFEKAEDSSGLAIFTSFLSTHPGTDHRIKHIRELIEKRGYSVETPLPLEGE